MSARSKPIRSHRDSLGDTDRSREAMQSMQNANRVADITRRKTRRSLIASLLITSIGFLVAMLTPLALSLNEQHGAAKGKVILGALTALAASFVIVLLTLLLRWRTARWRERARVAQLVSLTKILSTSERVIHVDRPVIVDVRNSEIKVTNDVEE
jgi:hypothetical protein